MHLRNAFLFTILLIFCGALPVQTITIPAEWLIHIESKTVDAGDPSVTVDFTMVTELPVQLITIPVVVREIDAGSFWTGQLPYDYGINPPVGVTWNWANPGWAMMFEDVRPEDGCATPGNAYDGVTPDNFAVECQNMPGMSGTEPAAPFGREFLVLQFAVTSQPGQFEFDTACATVNVHTLHLMDEDFVDHGPWGIGDCVFNKGIITIAAVPNDPPVLYCPEDQTVEIGDPINLTITATDDGVILPTLEMSAEDVPGFLNFSDNEDNSGTLSGTPGCGDPGEYAVRCIAYDGEHTEMCFIIITVNEDTEPPTAICIGNINVENDPGQCGAFFSFPIDATDNCPGVTVEAFPPSGTGFPVGTTEVEVIATDAVGHSNTCYFDVTVEDNEDPYLVCPEYMNVDNDPGQDYATVTYSVTASDNCGIANVDYDPPSGSIFYGGTTIVTVTATDVNDNVSICTFDVTVSVCICGVWGDVNDDGAINPVDVVYMVEYVYLTNDMRVQPPNCPLEAGDVNCDGPVNPVDVVFYVENVYLTNDMFCADPCGP